MPKRSPKPPRHSRHRELEEAWVLNRTPGNRGATGYRTWPVEANKLVKALRQAADISGEPRISAAVQALYETGLIDRVTGQWHRGPRQRMRAMIRHALPFVMKDLIQVKKLSEHMAIATIVSRHGLPGTNFQAACRALKREWRAIQAAPPEKMTTMVVSIPVDDTTEKT